MRHNAAAADDAEANGLGLLVAEGVHATQRGDRCGKSSRFGGLFQKLPACRLARHGALLRYGNWFDIQRSHSSAPTSFVVPGDAARAISFRPASPMLPACVLI